LIIEIRVIFGANEILKIDIFWGHEEFKKLNFLKRALKYPFFNEALKFLVQTFHF